MQSSINFLNDLVIRAKRSAVTGLALAVAALAGTHVAMAQQRPEPAPPTEQPSQKNPVPRAFGDAQNRGRAHDDKYWGITDANGRYFQIPFSRIPAREAVARGNGRLVDDGWQFPRLASQDPLRQNIEFGSENSVTTPDFAGGFTGALAAVSGVQFTGTAWTSVTTPSTSYAGANYQRSPAVPRTAGAIPDDTTVGAYAQTTVKWFPQITGDAGTLRRFTVRIYLPVPEDTPTDGGLASETRIEDARYIVYYQVRNTDGTFRTQRRVFFVAQTGFGYVTLNDSNGNPVSFPMATEGTAGITGAARPRVELDNSTESAETAQRFVIADQVQFVPASEYGEIKAPTTVTPTHGGRKIARPTGFALGAPYDPANRLNQPVWTDTPTARPYDPTSTGNRALLNDSFSFINNPRQIDYANNPDVGAPQPPLDPNPVVDPIYTTPTSPFYQAFQPWNPSTLFQGPRSLVNDQSSNTNPLGVVPANRTNQGRYEDAAGNPIPLFSHMQAIVARTEYVPDPRSTDGLGTVAVGVVYGVDWLTGAPIWRFPDRTYLPQQRLIDGSFVAYRDQYGRPVANAGLRNPNTTVNGVTVPTVPGIGAYDRNSDGYISDDEVYIVGQGNNASGGIEAGVTIIPRIYTRGAMQIPTYSQGWNPYTSPITGIRSDDPNTTPIAGIVTSPAGRYGTPSATLPDPVESSVAFIAADNGVMYAIDPYGNNDNRYYNYQNGATVDTTLFGTYHPGSTNIFWTFSTLDPARDTGESQASYNVRLKQSIPATGAFGRSTPVIAYQKSDDDTTLNRFTEEPRLFVGNNNGILYALNATLDAGNLVTDPGPPATTVYQFGAFPFRKDAHIAPNGTNTPDLRWWFETQGAINSSPAVSASVHPLSPADNTPKAKGIYVSSGDGRLYSLDWDGPVQGTDHNTNLVYDGTTTTAEALNDNFRFHNGNSAEDQARQDGTEGNVRPRWAFPSRYRDLDGDGNNSELAPARTADESRVIPGFIAERQPRLAPINSAPSLMDYPFRDTEGNVTIKRYVALVANDYNGGDDPVTGRVYLLSQVGDRRDFSVKPTALTTPAPDNQRIAFGQPEDMYAPTDFVFSDATPAWTYRPVYPRYNDNNGNVNQGETENVRQRNRPNQNYVTTSAAADDVTNPLYVGLPERRTLPTLFVGGQAGRLFALDIDQQTGLFLRWRGSIDDTRVFTPLPDTYPNDLYLPENLATDRRLNPINPALATTVTGIYGTVPLNNRPPLVRTVALPDADSVESLVISGGPMQNRNHPYPTVPPIAVPQTGPTVPFLPTNDAPNLLGPGYPFTLGTVSATPPNNTSFVVPSVVPAGTGLMPVTSVRNPYWTTTNVDNATNGAALDFTGFDPIVIPSFDLGIGQFTTVPAIGNFARTRFVNQDIDDPAATSRSLADPTISRAPDAPLPVGNALASRAELNRAYQYPLLAITTADNSFALISTELEGLDSQATSGDANQSPQGTDAEALMGWGLTTDLALANPSRPFMLALRGPGGPGTQVAIVTNAYYGAMDPGFRNNVRKRTGTTNPYIGTSPFTVNTTAAPDGDPSAQYYQYFPWFEPRYTTNSAEVLANPLYASVTDYAAPYNTPRPRFEPRSLYSGNTARGGTGDEGGPDGDTTTADGWPEIKADAHTGRTGFPLDLRGLFFDKAYADNRPQAARTGTDAGNTNDNGLVRLPAYTGIGEALTATNRRFRFSQNLQYQLPTDAVTYTLAVPDGVPDVPRDSSTGATSPYRTDPFLLFPGATYPNPDTTNLVQTALTPEADINPAGTNAIWMFVGGSDGVFYAYTPNRYTVPAAGGGFFGASLFSGLGGGNNRNNPGIDNGQYGDAKLILVSKTIYDQIRTRTTAVRPNPTGRTSDPFTPTIQGEGRRPFYEYGETIYAVIYDIGPNANGPLVDRNDDGIISDNPARGAAEATYPSTINITFSPSNRSDVPSVTVPARVAIASNSSRYAYKAEDSLTPRDPSLRNAPVADRAIALATIQVNTNFSAGNRNRAGGAAGATTNSGWTPGVIYTASIPGASGARTSATIAGAAENQPTYFMIANPLAVQAFLLSNEDGSLATVADPSPAGNRVYNGIGPFESRDDNATKNRTAYRGLLGGADPTQFDPDRLEAEYSQALANGNAITRYDLDPYLRNSPSEPVTGGNVPQYNPRVGRRLVTGSGASASAEPTFYLPVAASADMLPSSSGSTDVSSNKKTLRIANRSLLASLDKLRVEVRSDGLFRSWPGQRPNVAASDRFVNDPYDPAQPQVAIPATDGNPRLTPLLNANQYAMRPDGIINFLPWEQPVLSSLPWEQASNAVSQTSASQSNSSRDYPDIPARAETAQSAQTIKVVTASGDVVRGNGTVSGTVAGAEGSRVNLSIIDSAIRQWNFAGANQNFQAASARVDITLPNYQPANLVSMHSLTSTYEAPSLDEAPGNTSVSGNVQLPRRQGTNALDRAFIDRGLRRTNGATATLSDPHTVTPFGYTVQMRAYLDINGDGTWDASEPYRDFETWFGVPVNVSLKQAGASTVEMPGSTAPSGASGFSHGFGQQNGFLGYGTGTGGDPSIGFLPPFLQDSNVAGLGEPYTPFQAPFVVQSESNINLWNMRASQKIETYQRNPNDPDAFGVGTGQRYDYFRMQSETTEPRQGIMAVESDPNPSRLMPNVITSLDKKFDAAWDALIGNPARSPIFAVTLANGLTRYQAYYSRFGGRHPLHKPLVGGSSAAVLSIPDVPAGSLPPESSNGVFLPPIQANPTYLGVAVPLGTPSGDYTNEISGTPLAFFEDHDTNAPYRSRVVPSNATATALTLATAGPLYNGQNVFHPGTLSRASGNLNTNVILPTTGEGILRPRAVVALPGPNVPNAVYDYLPSTTVTTNNSRVAFKIRVRVKEAQLTGQITDQALDAKNFPPSVVNGVLPAIDNVPLFDINNIAPGGFARAASALSPAAYRTPSGNLVLFYNTNVDTIGNNRVADARPVAPFRLYGTSMTWNAGLGTWEAARIGAPINGANLFNAQNSGHWFQEPTLLTAGDPGSSLVSPFVLSDPLVPANNSDGPGNTPLMRATLLAMNVQGTSTGGAQYIPYFSQLANDGTPGTFQPLLPLTGNGRIDPTVRRFAPRAVFVPRDPASNNNSPVNGRVIVMYYGGTAGRNSLYYVSKTANAYGQITSTGGSEVQLPLPNAVTSASEPTPVLRTVRGQFVNNVWTYTYAANQPVRYAIDVHYTGVLRSGTSADLCVARFVVNDNGGLVRIDMPKQIDERLTATGRGPVYQSKHFGWYNTRNDSIALDSQNPAPIIRILNVRNNSATSVVQTIGPKNWQIDNATKTLFQQSTLDGRQIIVYVDTTAGVVTFRGEGAPLPGRPSATANSTYAVTATYTPLSYRVAGTNAVESSPFAFMDRRPVQTGLIDPRTGQPAAYLGNLLGGVNYGELTRIDVVNHPDANVARTSPLWDATQGQGIDREWIFWQRSNQGNVAASLYYTTRRVGVDLRALNLLRADETVKFDATPGNPARPGTIRPVQIPLINVQAESQFGTNDWSNVPFEVDPASGKVFVQANMEGLSLRVIFTKTTQNGADNTVDTVSRVDTQNNRIPIIATPIDEISSDGQDTVGRAVPMAQRSNDNQAYAFLDYYVGSSFVNRGNVAPGNDLFPTADYDPALQPGKVWMFWSSSRGRTGLLRVPAGLDGTFGAGVGVGDAITSHGYDLFWQTLAPQFSKPSYSAYPAEAGAPTLPLL